MPSQRVDAPGWFSNVTRGQRQDIRGEADLTGSTLVLPAGYSINEHIRNRFPVAKIVEVPDIPTALRRISLGEADATILSIGVAGYWLDHSEITNLRIASTFGRPSTLSMAVRNDWPDLFFQERLDQVIRSERNVAVRELEQQDPVAIHLPQERQLVLLEQW